MVKYPIKMYNSKMFNNIEMYKDSRLMESWGGFMENKWMVEVKNDKARVYSNNPFTKKPSFFNKLILIKKLSRSNHSVFQLTVNGYQTFFVMAHIIKK